MYVIQEYIDNKPGDKFFSRWDKSLYGALPIFEGLEKAKRLGAEELKPMLRQIRRTLSKGQQVEAVTRSKAWQSQAKDFLTKRGKDDELV